MINIALKYNKTEKNMSLKLKLAKPQVIAADTRAIPGIMIKLEAAASVGCKGKLLSVP